MSNQSKRRSFAGLTPAAWILSSAAFLTLASCGGGASGPSCIPAFGCPIVPSGIYVDPRHATLAAGSTRTITATVYEIDDKRVTWSVQEGPAGGTITQTGIYSAPSTPGVYHVVATASNGDTAVIRIAVPSVFRRYMFVPLGELLPYAINGRDQMAGTLREPLSIWPTTFVSGIYENGTIRQLGVFEAMGINNSGVVVGRRLTSGFYKAVLHDGNTLRDLGTLPRDSSSEATAINSSGQVAGTSSDRSYSDRAFLYSGGSMSFIGPGGSTYSSAKAINDSGQVVGRSSDYLAGSGHAFLHSGGVTSLLPEPPGFTDSSATDINAAGRICGTIARIGGTNASGIRLFSFTNGQMNDLGGEGLFGYQDQCYINSTGLIAGNAGTMGPFLYDGQLIQLIEQPAGLQGRLKITDLADNGKMTAILEMDVGRQGYLLVPQ